MNLRNRLQYMKRLCTAHFVANAVLSVLFLVLRTIRPFCTIVFPRAEPECNLEWRESNILMFLICVVVIKNRKFPDVMQFVKILFSLSKVANFLLFFYSDLRLAIVYSVLCLLVVLIFPEPAFKGPENITYFKGEQFFEELENNPRTTWMLECYAAWSPTCQRFASVFADLSLNYSHNHFKFGKLDVGTNDKLAKRLGINTSGTSLELPTLILFQNGKPVIRRPVKNNKGKVIPFQFTMGNMIRDFDMKVIYEETKSKAQKKQEKKAETLGNNENAEEEKKDK
ncbi:thioredoxin-related transmembrane protein 2-like [Antedon mediterranea]|uniref:thioredoxin-related transmembrane protein 2-like n=1 Tax=Antedon mediterranea TaxID=105859 RepID=UPI003AF89827